MIFLAGCNGHIGKEIVKKCVERSIPFRGFDVKPLEIKWMDTSKLDVVTGDITNPEQVKKASAGAQVIMDVIGLRKETKELTHEMVEHGGMKNLIEAARKNKIGHIIYISVGGVAPGSPAKTIQAKWNTEQSLINSGITYTIFRPSGYFSDFLEYFAPTIIKTGKMQAIGDGTKRMQPVAPEDVAEALLQSAGNEKAKNKIFGIAGPEIFTYNELVELIAKVVGKPVTIAHKSLLLLKVVFTLTGASKDFLYRATRESINTPEEEKALKEAFNINFQRIEPWLRENLKKQGMI
jgi:uncharacterized protein YbjT (DUF2867 family)